MKTAFIFPGQGSQTVGMLSEFYAHFDYVQNLSREANDTLGYDLWDIIANDEKSLNKTIYTQPAMLLANIMCLEVLKQETNITPNVVAGHSLGELCALVSANVVDFATAIKIVHKRAHLMQECVPEGVGSMAAILGLDDEMVVTICSELSTNSECVEAVNFNAPGQVVIAGHSNQVSKACEVLKDKGAKRAIVLPVSIPSHSSLMKSAGEEFLSFINDFLFNTPTVMLLHNVDARDAHSSKEIKTKLSEQLYNPVRWVETIVNSANKEVDRYIEVGPGKVLTGLNKRINKELDTYALFDLVGLNALQQ